MNHHSSRHPRHVLLVHGIFDTGKVFRRMADELALHGFLTHSPDLTPNSGKKGLEHLAHQLAGYIEQHLPQGEPFSLVGFSLGGIVSRYYMQRLGGIGRVRKFVSISAPHDGSLLAHALPNEAGRQLRPGSDFLRELNRNASILEAAHPVSIWTPFDLSILPAESSRLPFWTDVPLPVKLHPWMLTDQRCIHAVIRELKEGSEVVGG